MDSKYEIVYSHDFEDKISEFIDYMAQTCRYKDSGIYSEDLIVENFINDVKSFIRELRNNIESKINIGIIGQIEVSKLNYKETKLIIFIRSYNILCKCKIYENQNIILLDDIYIRT